MFIINFVEYFRNRAIVPCKNRVYFNSLVGEKFEMVTWKGIPYTISVSKNRATTELEGDWSMFVHDHQIVPGDSVMMLSKILRFLAVCLQTVTST
uniref:TF-B3 domain-containing protein n=1 Tax=Arundo donax TaxID=35708 RepID=A0A0A9D4A5_ARUDO